MGLERAAHVGGRCEARRIGKLDFPAWHLDFRSQHLAIMATEDMPVALTDYVSGGKSELRLRPDDDYRVIARVTVQTGEPCYPYRRESDIIYPVGRFTTTLCGQELADAVHYGRVLKWHAVAWYRMTPALKEFASVIYQIRRAGDLENQPQISSWAKYMGNALPGKLGYRAKYWETVVGACAPEAWGEYLQPNCDGKLERWRSIAWVCQREVVGGYGPDALPAMAAWISSCARMRLLTAIRRATWDHVYYYDTDSLIVDETGLKNLESYNAIRQGELGCLELRAGPAEVEICGIKMYVTDGKLTWAGLPKGICAESPDGRGHWYTPPVSANLKDGAAREAKAVFHSSHAAGEYTHGRVQKDGSVSPHIIEETL